MPDYYDPAAQLVMHLAAALKDELNLSKDPAVYFDGHYFIINKASAANMPPFVAQNIAQSLQISYIDNKKEGFYHFCISNEWILRAVQAFPAFHAEGLGIEENALAVRMQAHAAFGFGGDWTSQSYAAALLLFKIIHTKSARIRQQTGIKLIRTIEEHLRLGYLPGELRAAIINAVHMLNIYNRGFL